MAQYGRWIDIDGNLYYFDTEKGEIEYKEKEPKVEYKIHIDPMPIGCPVCPMYVYKGWDDYVDYCHLNGSIHRAIKYDPVQKKYFYGRPNDCPLERGE